MSQTKVQLVNDVIGNSGFGDDSPDRELVVKKASSNATVKIEASNAHTSQLFFSDTDTENVARISVFHGSGSDQNSMLFGTAGSTRLAITSAGRVGIGTISPSSILHVVDSGTTAAEIKLENDEGSLSLRTDNNVGTYRANQHLFQAVGGSSEYMRINNSGNVGIGDTSPTAELSVAATAPHIDIGQAGSTRMKIGYEGNNCFFGGTASTAMFIFKQNVDLEGHPQASGTERMRINSNGAVSIANTRNYYGALNVEAGVITSDSSAIDIKASGTNKKILTFGDHNTIGGDLRLTNNSHVGLGTNSDHPFTFYTGTGRTERMRLSSSGNFFHGRTSNIVCNSVNTSNNFEQIDSFTWTLGLHADQAHKIGLAILYSSTNNNHDFIRCHVSGSGGRFVVESDGDCFNQNGTYSQLSDISLKENIVDAKSQWNDIKNLKVRNFNFKESTGRPTHTQIGLVAQELEIVCPNLVKESEEGLKTVANSVLYMKAIKCLQEAMAKIEVLETKVTALEAK